jgi:hypothetical protein
MFNKIGDSTLLKVQTIKQGSTSDVLIAKCTKCGKPADVCRCSTDPIKEEPVDAPKP